jgi:hypothetical protein
MRMLLVSVLAIPALVLAQEAQPPPEKKPAKEQVYKYVDEKGVVHYTDQPPNDAARPARLPPLQTYQGGTTPDLGRFGKTGPEEPSAAEPPALQVQLVTPAPDETFRGAERVVPVAVVVTPALAPNQRLVYYLDGTPRSGPVTDTAFAFTGVDRGAHTASAAVVDESGQELARTPAVTFHMKPPIAR